jgi:magnesium transporter
MIRTLYRSTKGGMTTDVPETHWKVALRDTGGLFWVDFAGEPEERVEKLLTEVFTFHPLAIEDALQQAHVPKVDDWGEYVYAVLHGISFDPKTNALDTNEIDIFLGKNFLVTHHKNPQASADRVWKACQRDERYLARGADYLLYNMADVLVSDFMPVVDQLDDAIDHLEDEVFTSTSRAVLGKIFSVKRAVLHLRRIITPQREVMNRLARDTYDAVDPSERIYFRDVYDHLVRLADINDTLRDLISGTLDTYLSVSANRTNDTVKILTIFSAMFLPISFIAGFFGMNFEWLPFSELWFLIFGLMLMIIVPAIMWWWIERKRWIE